MKTPRINDGVYTMATLFRNQLLDTSSPQSHHPTYW